MSDQTISPSDQLMKFITAKWISKPVYIAAELRIADLLAENPRSIEELADITGTRSDALYRIMRALACVGIFCEKTDRIFELTPMGGLLRTGIMRSMALMFNSGWNEEAWLQLPECLKTGDIPFEKAHKKPLTEWLEQNPDSVHVFNEANAIRTAAYASPVIKACGFSDAGTFVDIGGGTGILAAEILIAYPSLRGVIADLPEVVRHAGDTMGKYGITDGWEAVECDFFDSVPSEGDVYILSSILHDWHDDKCKSILENCRKAMRKESMLLIIEMIVPEGNEFSVSKLLDLEMMVITGGKERTETEFRELTASAGLNISRIIPVMDLHIIECVK
ncbi:methyltransferase [candidate division KSB1 bacterium]